jgi:hypothetical protein
MAEPATATDPNLDITALDMFYEVLLNEPSAQEQNNKAQSTTQKG